VSLRETHLGVRELVHGIKRTLGRIAAELMGVKAVRVYDDEALIKEPFSTPTFLHWDAPAWSHDSPVGVSAWFALDDATVQNGAMYMLSGSHLLVKKQYEAKGRKWERPPPDPNHHEKMNDVFSPDGCPEARPLPISPVTMPAGSVSFHSGMTIHGAGPNMTQGRRRAMVFAMMPDGCIFNGHNDIFTEKQFAQLKAGDLLTNERMYPLAWKAEE